MNSGNSNRTSKRRPFWYCCNRFDWREDISPESSIEILMKRYANGEINKEEFEKMKQDITES